VRLVDPSIVGKAEAMIIMMNGTFAPIVMDGSAVGLLHGRDSDYFTSIILRVAVKPSLKRR